MPPAFHIISYSPEYQPQFYALNAAWIGQHYTLEEEDKRFLSDPVKYLINNGGMVFFLLEDGQVAGTCGLLKMDNKTYELVRMTVDTRYRGKGYGKALINHAIGWAKARGALQVILETGSVLKTAIALYEKLGFAHHIPDPAHRSALARADVFMRKPID